MVSGETKIKNVSKRGVPDSIISKSRDGSIEEVKIGFFTSNGKNRKKNQPPRPSFNHQRAKDKKTVKPEQAPNCDLILHDDEGNDENYENLQTSDVMVSRESDRVVFNDSL
jgi:hypothetical protein